MQIHKEGRAMLIVFFLVAALINFLLFYYLGSNIGTWIILVIMVILFLFFLRFYRNPERVAVGDELIITAPADGKIVILEKVFESEYLKEERIQVSVFMSFFNVHVNWFPITGDVEYFKYHPGNYLAAWHPKSSVKNERTTIVINNNQGDKVLMRQIAGKFARRVVCYAEMGKRVVSGTQAGFIKFGSRADLFLPLDTEICVNLGDNVVGGETIIAKLPLKKQ